VQRFFVDVYGQNIIFEPDEEPLKDQQALFSIFGPADATTALTASRYFSKFFSK
jgi:hypothetical protein